MALGAVLALHALALGALLAYEPARSALLAVAPIIVKFVAPVKVEPKPTPLRVSPPPPRAEVKPSPPAPAPVAPQPVVTAPAKAPLPAVAPAPPPAPAAPEAASVAAARLQLAQTPTPAPAAAITAPVFNADYLENPPPAYPAFSRRLGEQGRVILRVLVGAAGSIEEIQIRTTSGHARLDDAAREAVRRWKFVPAKRGELPVAAWVLIPISFSLEG